MVKIDSDGDVAVAFGNQAWVYNPGLLTPVTGGKVDVLDDEADSDSAQEEEDDSNGNNLNYLRTTKSIVNILTTGIL